MPAAERWVLVVERAELGGDLQADTRVFGPWRNRNHADNATTRVERFADELTATHPGLYRITARVVQLEPEDNGRDGSLFGLLRQLVTIARGADRG